MNLAFNTKYILLLKAISNNYNSQAVRSLCKGISIQNTATKYIKNMEILGFIRRYKKGRKYYISMTKKGKKLLEFYDSLTKKEVN